MKKSIGIVGVVLVVALVLSRPWAGLDERAALTPGAAVEGGAVDPKHSIGEGVGGVEASNRDETAIGEVEPQVVSPRASVDLAQRIREIEASVNVNARAGMLEGALFIKRLVEAGGFSPAEVLAACEVDAPTWGLVFLRTFALPSDETDAWTVAIAESDTGERPKDASVAAGIATALFGGLEAKHRLFELNFQRSPSSLGLSRPNWLPMDLLREVEPEELDRWVAALRSKGQLDVFGEAAIESVLARLGTQQARHTLIDEATAGVESPALFARLIEDPQLTSPLGVLANRPIPPGPGPAPARVANAKKAAYAGLLRIGTDESLQLVFDGIAERGGRYGPGSPNSSFQGPPLPRVFPKILGQLASIPPGTHADTSVHDYLERTAAEIPGMILTSGSGAGQELLKELGRTPRPGDKRAAAAYDAVIAELERWL